MTERIESIRRPTSKVSLALAVAETNRKLLEEWAVELYDLAGIYRGEAEDIENKGSLRGTPEGIKYWFGRQRHLRHAALHMELGAEALLTQAGYNADNDLAQRLKQAEANARELFSALMDLGLRTSEYEPTKGTEEHGRWELRAEATRRRQQYLQSRQPEAATAAE